MSEVRSACFGVDPDREGWPTVSVVIPVRNEATHVTEAVDSILRQSYPGSFDVCLAVAPSDDETAEIVAEVASREPRVSLVPNPSGVTPAGLNAAIAATRGEVVVRVDGHAWLSDGYIRRAVETMMRTGAVNVGGRQVPLPRTPFEVAVATATTSGLGTGGARYRVGGTGGPVDTVYLGVFDRAAGDAVGWFDESLIRNQDYELNIRLRLAGGTIWFDPELWVGYRPRGTMPQLVRQYFEYGWWKAEVLRRHPGSVKARQIAPAAATIGLLTAGAVGHRIRSARLMPLAYVGVLTAISRDVRVTYVAAAIHLSWGAGLITGLVGTAVRRHRGGVGPGHFSSCNS